MTNKQTPDRAKIFEEITAKMAEMYKAKNHDYGGSFSKSVAEFGIVAAVIRMNDKMERLKSISKMTPEQMKVKNESIQDTLLDLANYAVMTLVELQTPS